MGNISYKEVREVLNCREITGRPATTILSTTGVDLSIAEVRYLLKMYEGKIEISDCPLGIHCKTYMDKKAAKLKKAEEKKVAKKAVKKKTVVPKKTPKKVSIQEFHNATYTDHNPYGVL